MKRKFAILLVLVLALSACAFSLAACDKEPDDFEKYELYKYLTDYQFISITAYEKDGETYKEYSRCNTFLQEKGFKTSYDNIVGYRDGDYGGTYNEMLLKARAALLQLGETITVRRNETEFSGTLGKTASELIITKKMAAFAYVAIKWEFDEDTIDTLLFDYEEEVDIHDLIGFDPLSYFNVWVDVTVDEPNPTETTNEFKILIRYSMFW